MRDRTQVNWYRKKQKLWEQCISPIIDELQEFWPLTIRQVHYQLVSRYPERYPNTPASYNTLISTLAVARLQDMTVGEHLLWDAIEDRSRAWPDKPLTWENATEFFRNEINGFLDGYWYERDRQQGQAVDLLLWIEKDALAGVFSRAAHKYRLPVISARGYSSISFAHKCRQLALYNASNDRETKILYFGDLDPSGWDAPLALMRTLQSEMSVASISSERVALLPEQAYDRAVGEYRYPVVAIKSKDTRSQGYRAMLIEDGYPPNLAVELDAIPAGNLAVIVKDAIERNLDMDAFAEVEAREELDRQWLSDKRELAMELLRDLADSA